MNSETNKQEGTLSKIQASSSLANHQVIYKHIFHISNVAILIHDSHGNIIDANAKAQKILEFDFNTQVGPNLTNLIFNSGNAESKLNNYLAKAESTGQFKMEESIKTKSGKIIQCTLLADKIKVPEENLFTLNIKPKYDPDFQSFLSDEKENINRQLIESAYDAILIMDDEKFIFCNKSALNIFGCAKYEDLVYHSPWEFSPPNQPDGTDSMLKAKLYINEALAGNPKRFLWQHIKKDGVEFEAEVSLNALDFKGGKYIQAIVRDISFRNKMERQIKESESRFKSLFNNINAGVAHHEIIVDKAGKPVDFTFLAVNPVYETITKLKASDIIGRRGKEVLPDIEQKWIDFFDKVASTGEPASTIDHSSYLNKWWDVKAFSPKKGQFAVVLTDITEQKISQIKLENARLSMQQAEEIGQLGFFERNWKTGKGYWSKGLFKLLGIKYQNEAFTHEDFISYIHPDDVERATAHLENSLKADKLMDFEFRILQKGGDIIWLHGTGKNEFDDNGNPVRTIGIVRDITESRRMKNTMDKFFEQPINIHIIVDMEGTMLKLNKGWENILGYKIDELKGTKIYDHIHPDDISNTEQEMSKLADGQTTFYFQNRYKHKGGGYRWLAWSAIASLEDNLIYAVASDITESHQARKELEAQNLSYATLLSNLNGMVYRCRNDHDWTMEFVSEGCTDITGYKPEHLVENKILAFNDIILPKYQKHIWGTWQKHINAKLPVEMEYEIQTASGEIKWVWEKGRGIFDDAGNLIHIEGIISDITERKIAEDQASKLSKAVEQSPESIVITDKSGVIEYVNPQFTKLTGYSYDEAMGQNPRILQSGEHDQTYYKNLWCTILEGNEWYGEFRNKKKNGELYWERASISPIQNNDGEINHFVAVKEDITQDKKILAELKKAKEQAEESDRLKSAFLANMSHEIRTPMNGIIGFAELLQEPDLSSEEKRKYSGVIIKSGERMLNIINDLIDISKIESGQMELVVSNTNLNKQINFLYTFFKPEAEAKGFLFSYKKGLSDNEATIITDKEKVYAILTNLLKNALKYTNEGTIEFGYTKTTDTKTKAPMLQFYVKDTGIGIARNRHQAIFERFVQADLQIAKPYEGAGLGLAITKAYTQMLGGKIWVDSDPGKGSAFYFTIPYHTRPSDKTTAVDHEKFALAEKSLQNLRVLIVEDDETADLFLTEILDGNCKELLHAKSGTKAIELCKDDPDIDLILMDIKMHEVNGYDATKEIRKFNKDIIIIAQTAFALAGDREKSIEAGCNDYIAKPVKRNELIQLINNYF